MNLRDHTPTVIEEFKGLWKRGDEDSTPIDHFPDCNNVQYFDSGVETRDGLDIFLAVGNVLRMYNYKLQSGESLLILTEGGSIYHALLDGSDTVYGPILTIPEMTDYGFTSFNGRAYISPFTTFTNANGENYQKGLEDEFLYVYKGDGTDARPAAGMNPTSSDTTPLIAYNSAIDGVIDQGIHIIAITFSDGADDSTGLGTTIKPIIYAPGGKQATVQNMQIGPVGVTERKLWMTHAINPEVFDPDGTYTFYLAKTIADNTTISTDIDIADIDLVVPFVAGTLPNPTSGGIEISNTNNEGYCDLGLHIIGVVYETDTGYLTAPGPEVLGVQTFVNENRAILVENIPVSPNSYVTKRHLVASKAINNYNGDDLGYQLFFIPDGTLNDNTTTELEVSFYDIDLIDDASHLLDNFEEIPAGVTLTDFHGRMVLTTTFTDISLAYFSAPGEPEAFDQVDGIVIVPLDGNPITNGQEFRDVFYLFKKTRTYAVTDNGDVPSTWSIFPIDLGIGASVHGIAQVLDSGGTDIDFLMIVDYSGIMLFNGAYARPELTWKIADFWKTLERNDYANIQILNNTLDQIIFMTLPDRQMLIGFYDDGLTAKDVKWTPWTFDINTTTIALVDTNTLLIGSNALAIG